jgi:WD40 repeat protein
MVSRPGGPVDGIDEPLPPRAVARIGTYQFYHGPGINCAALSPNGRIIASTSVPAYYHLDEKDPNDQEKIIVLWDSATGKRIRELKVPHAPAFGLSFSPNGKQLAADFGATQKKSGIAIFDVDSGKLFKQFADDGLRFMQFSTDGKAMFVSENYQDKLALWNIESGKCTRSWDRPAKQSEWLKGREYVWQGMPSPDGTFLAWLVDEAPDYSKLPLDVIPPPHIPAPTALIIVDADSGKPIYRKEFPKNCLHRFVFSADGRRFITSGDKVTAYETETGKKQFDLDAESTHDIALSPNGQFAAIMTGASQVRLWNLETKKLSHELLSGMIPVMSGLGAQQTFSDDGKLVLIATLSTLRLFDTETGKERLSLGHRSRVTPRFSDDGKTLITTCDEIRRTWDVSSRKEPKLIREARRNTWEGVCGGQVTAHSEDWQYFVAKADKDKLKLCDTATGKVLRYLEGSPHPIFGMFSNDTTRLLIWYGAIGEDFDGFRLYDIQTGKKTGEMKTPNRAGYYPAISADGRFIAWADHTHAIHLHNGTTGKLVRTFQSERALDTKECSNADILFSPDGKQLIVTTYLHDLFKKPDGEKCRTLPTRVFRVADGEEISRFYGNPESKCKALPYSCAVCSPDGRLLAVAERESPTIRLIEIASGKVHAEFTGHRHGVHGLAFSPDGKTLASGGEDAVVILWDVYDSKSESSRD